MKTVTGVVVGAGAVLIPADRSGQLFGVGLAILAIAGVTLYARRTRGAAIHSAIVVASLVIAVAATIVAGFGPEESRGYALLASGLLTLVAMLAAEDYEASIGTLAGVACIGAGVAVIGLGVTLILGEPLAAVACIGAGAAVVVAGVALLSARRTLASVAGILAGVASIGLGVILNPFSATGILFIGLGVVSVGMMVAVLRGSSTLAGITLMGLGVASIALGFSVEYLNASGQVVAMGFGVAGIGLGFAVLLGSDSLAGIVLIGLGVALVGYEAIRINPDPLWSVMLIGLGVACSGAGVALLSRGGAAHRLRSWWTNFTSVGGRE